MHNHPAHKSNVFRGGKMQAYYDALLNKYWRFIKKEVRLYCKKFNGFTSVSSIYDDLFDEACIAFLNKCDTMDIEDCTLNALQTYIVKLEMQSRMRLYVWRHFNMRGEHHKRIDYGRNVYLEEIDSDFLQTEEDYSNSDVKDFLNKLDVRKRKIITLSMNGLTPPQIASLLHVSPNTVRNEFEKIRNLYINYYGEPQLA